MKTSRIIALLPIAAFVALLMPVLVSAESVSWNTTVPNTLYACVGNDDPNASWDEHDLGWGWGYDCSSVLQSPNVSISYNAEAIDPTTGDDICGGTVSQGAQVEFQFEPHSSQDISWFGTGFDMDSPYGNWSDSAASPPVSDESQWCSSQNYLNTWGYASNKSYVALQVNPPTGTLTNAQGFDCGTPDSDGTVTCTATGSGAYDPTFTYSSTYGLFYYAAQYSEYWAAYWPELTSLNGCMVYPDALDVGNIADSSAVFGTYDENVDGATYTLQVPSQSISCPITIASSTSGLNAPSISDDLSSCSADGVPTYDISASDSDASAQVRYGISWDDSGTVEEWLPANGYVPQGTEETTEQAGASATFEVMAQDSNGNSSAWATHTAASCSSGGACPAGELSEGSSCVSACDSGFLQQGNSCECPSGYTQNGNQCTESVCQKGYQLEGSQCVFVGCQAGPICQNGNLYTEDSKCDVSSQPVQSCNYGCNDAACSPPPSPDIANWQVKPTLVKSGETTSVIWQATNVSACTITGTNGDSWTGLLGTQVSQPILSQTVYTILCLGLPGASPASATQSATVNVVPNFNEQ